MSIRIEGSGRCPINLLGSEKDLWVLEDPEGNQSTQDLVEGSVYLREGQLMYRETILTEFKMIGRAV